MSPSTKPSGVRDVLLVGFGAVGAIYSLILKRSGYVRLTVVARSNYDAVNKDGVQIKSGKFGEINGWRPDRLVRSVDDAADRPYSYVFVSTKAIPERSTTPQILQPLLSPAYADVHPQPTYVLLQNGLNVEVDLYHELTKLGKGEPSIISSSVYVGTNLVAPNVVEHNELEKVVLGVYRHDNVAVETDTPNETALLEDIGGILKAGGSAVTTVPEIQREKFSKNLWNVAFSSFSTLTHYRVPSIFRPPPTDSPSSYAPYVHPATADLIATYTIPTIRATLQELVELGRAIGYPDSPNGLPSSFVDFVIERTRMLHNDPGNTHKTSMMLDMERNQPIEVEVILGEPVRMAKAHGVAVPRVEMLYALLLVVQNQILRKLETGQSE